MKRRDATPRVPAIPPFIDHWGQPTYENPFGRNRANPALTAAANPAPVAPPIASTETPAVPQPAVVAHRAAADPAAVVPAPVAPTAPVLATVVTEVPEVAAENAAAILPARPSGWHKNQATTGWAEAIATEVAAENAAAILPARPSGWRMNQATTGWAETIAATTTHSVSSAVDTTSPVYLEALARYRKVFGLDANETPVERIADRHKDRRSRIHRRVRRSVAVVTAVGSGLVGITAASAYFTSGGTGTGSGSTGSLAISVAAATGTPTTPLLPGGDGDVILDITNPNSYAVKLISVSGNGAITPDLAHASAGCSAAGGIVTYTDHLGLSNNIPGGNVTTHIELSGAAHMTAAAASACQRATFTIPVTVAVQTP